MTNEQAIKWLKDYLKNGDFSMPQYEQALEMAIQALSQEPCDDAVSIQVVKEQMIKYGFHAPDMTVTEFVEDLPSVTQKSGKWERVSIDTYVQHAMARYKCSVCDKWTIGEPNFCPNCGAKMVEPQERSDKE